MTKEIKALRKERGHDKEREWDIWRDGCEGGEYVLPASASQRDKLTMLTSMQIATRGDRPH